MNLEPDITNRIIIQHSAGPIRWMPAGSMHRAIINKRVFVVERDTVTELDGGSRSRFLNPDVEHTPFDDPVIAELSRRFHGLRPLTDGGLWEGLFTSITGQAVSLHSASAFQRRLCKMLSPRLEAFGREFRSLPDPELVGDCSVDRIRSSGLTTNRAKGLIAVARAVADGDIPDPPAGNADVWMRNLTGLPMVGPWTAASSLLWGVGHPDVYPPGDVALLRAARAAYDDAGMTMTDLNKLSERWRPQRAIAARLLWTNLLGMGWESE